ncbi:DNA alkylation repair protein [Candidatus Pacearchaeota archaeon]|nr:DNA alkylation repair protein [Candidatus Pacearchaeota archaeon]
MTTLQELNKALEKEKNAEQAQILARFFKTGKGQYGEGDIFLGIKVPVQRRISKQFKELTINDLQQLLSSKVHEKRLISLFILIQKYKQSDETAKEEIFEFYLKNAKNVNNWDLVDLSAPNIVGDFLLSKDKKVLYKLAKSTNLWENRIAILATFTFIRNNQFKDTLNISKLLLNHSHDLIHKAVGWMLREIGKRDLKVEEDFLQEDNRYNKIPRTMLRYAIERFEESKRQKYLKGKI